MYEDLEEEYTRWENYQWKSLMVDMRFMCLSKKKIKIKSVTKEFQAVGQKRMMWNEIDNVPQIQYKKCGPVCN